MEEIIFETHPGFIVLCLAVAVAYSFVLYQTKYPWSRQLNWLLFGCRAVLVFLLAVLLLNPVLKQLKNILEKPVFVILQDNSVSMKEVTDSLTRQSISNAVGMYSEILSQNGNEVVYSTLSETNSRAATEYNNPTTDLQSALRQISNRYEGRSVSGVLLISDGIYNSGLSPLYGTYNFPVYTWGIGDTVQRQDVSIKELVYNKIAYQGNKFPLRAEVLVNGYPQQDIQVTLIQAGKVIDKQIRNSGTNSLVFFEFTPVAAEQGIQRYDVQVEVKKGEYSTRNNRATAFVEVVEGKKKILVIASSPHPDIKALRAVIEKNPNYEFLLHIQNLQETEAKYLLPQNIDLAIFHQLPDKRGTMRELVQRFANSKTSTLTVVGAQTDLSSLSLAKAPLTFEQPPRQYDDVLPVINPGFAGFTFSAEASATFSRFPPVWVPFAKMKIPGSSSVLLFQKVGSLTTDKPLLWIDFPEGRKVAVLLAEGFWQWRLEEFSKAESTETFDEVFGKLIQYLSTSDDRSKFKSYPAKQQFAETETVEFESQVYNDIYEPVFGYRIDIELTDESGKKFPFNYITSPGNIRYRIGGLNAGIYTYRSRVEINGRPEEVRGQFLVTAQDVELQNLTADFDLLRKLSKATGGSFFTSATIQQLNDELSVLQAKATIHTEEKFDGLLTMKWVFFILLLLVSAEWFLRKYYGSY